MARLHVHDKIERDVAANVQSVPKNDHGRDTQQSTKHPETASDNLDSGLGNVFAIGQGEFYGEPAVRADEEGIHEGQTIEDGENAGGHCSKCSGSSIPGAETSENVYVSGEY